MKTRHLEILRAYPKRNDRRVVGWLETLVMLGVLAFAVVEAILIVSDL